MAAFERLILARRRIRAMRNASYCSSAVRSDGAPSLSDAVRSDGAPSLSDEMKGLLRQYLTDNPALRVAIEANMDHAKQREKELIDLAKQREKELMDLAKERETILMVRAKEREKFLNDLLTANEKLLKQMEQTVKEKASVMFSLEVNLLRSRGLNNTRGLFEFLQEKLEMKILGCRSTLRGPALWEALLKFPAARDLRSCITKAIGVKGLVRQAAHLYGIYSNLSSHVHSGKYTAELASATGKIQFERGPLSPDQAKVLCCLADAANCAVEELKDTGTSVY